MKKILLLTIVLALPMLASARDTMDGCGLGWEVTKGETMIATTTRGTTNAFVPPTFGMTSGTLGCKKLQFAKKDQESAEYVTANFANLKQELAMGNGEYVDGLFEVMNCRNAKSIKKDYNKVVAPAANGVELYRNLQTYCI